MNVVHDFESPQIVSPHLGAFIAITCKKVEKKIWPDRQSSDKSEAKKPAISAIIKV